MHFTEPERTLAATRRILKPGGTPVALAAARGDDTRTGLEDTSRLPDGSIAANNAALVAAARHIIATSPRS